MNAVKMQYTVMRKKIMNAVKNATNCHVQETLQVAKLAPNRF